MRGRTRIASVVMAVVMVTSMSAIFVAASSGSPNSIAMDKLEPELRTQVMEALAGSSAVTFNTIGFLDDSADFAASGKEMSRAGAVMKERFDSLGAYSVDMSGGAAMEVAMLDQVTHVFLDEYKYRLLDASDAETSAAKAGVLSPDVALESEEIWWASTSEVMGAEDVWAEGIDGTGVLVAVLDTGCDITQNDIAPAVLYSQSFTSEEFHDVDGHGTATAGLVASRGVNEYDFTAAYGVVMKMKGMAPGASLMTGKVLDDTGYGWDSWIIGGIEWAVEKGADVISMSLGGLEVPNDGNDPTSYALDIAARDHGVVSFLSAGNEGAGQSTIGASGVSKSVITVGASTLNKECQLIRYWPLSNYDETALIVKPGEDGYEDDHMIWWSSHGPTADGRIDPDISAAGAWGPSTQPGNTLMIQFGGTSMAAPVAAGIGALIIQAYTAENGVAPTPEQVKSIMMGTALDMGYTPNEQGPGRADALAAYNAVMDGWAGPGHASLALTVPMGSSETVEFAEGAVLGSNAIVPSDVPTMHSEGTVMAGEDLFYEFEVPDGISYIAVDLAFDQGYLFKKDVYKLTKPAGFTDTHNNLIVYRLDENGERTMLNYAYSHTNTQELSVKVTPGMYELRVSPVIYAAPSVPFIYSIEFFETVDWSWFSAEGSVATISVPSDAMAGAHTAFIEAEYDGVCSLVPVAVSVPIEFGVPVEDVNDVGHEVYAYTEGDWKYYYVEVPAEDTPDAITSVLDWESEYTDIDTYWINPATRVVEASLTGYLGLGMFGPWETSSMETSDVLTVMDPEPGMWMFALHNVMMDCVLEEPYTLTVYPYSAAEFGVDSVAAKPGKPATISLANNVDQKVGVGLAAVTGELATTTVEFEGTVSSIDEGGTGAIEVLFDVAALTQSISLTVEWGDEAADIDVVIYAADWSNAGILWENGDSVTIEDPTTGEWDAAVALKNSASKVTFVLTVVMTTYQPWSSVSLSATSFWLEPGACVDFTASLRGPTPFSAQGMIVAYDLMTGCEYDTILISGRA
ncbi:MAG: S8 family serine peptidase [Thermoplasmata archaeon]